MSPHTKSIPICGDISFGLPPSREIGAITPKPVRRCAIVNNKFCPKRPVCRPKYSDRESAFLLSTHFCRVLSTHVDVRGDLFYPLIKRTDRGEGIDLPGGKIPGYLGDPLEGAGNTLFYTFTSSACHLDTRVSYGVAPGGRKIPGSNQGGISTSLNSAQISEGICSGMYDSTCDVPAV